MHGCSCIPDGRALHHVAITIREVHLISDCQVHNKLQNKFLKHDDNVAQNAQRGCTPNLAKLYIVGYTSLR